MKCPKCQTEINSNAKFCTKCGCNLASEMAKVMRPPAPSREPACAKCGAPLKPGARFCTKCGEAAATPETEKKTVMLYKTDVQNGDTPQEKQVHEAPPMLDEIIPPENKSRKEKSRKEKNKKTSRSAETQQEDKAGRGMIIAAVVLLLLALASGVVCVLVWNGTIDLPFLSGGNAEGEEEGSTEETESSTEDGSGESAGAELFAEADALLAEGKNQTAVDAEILTGMENIRNAMNQFADKALESGSADAAADRIADAYAAYVAAVTRRKDMMSAQGLSGSIYNQVMSEIKDAEALAQEMAEKGYSVDTASLATLKDAFHTDYTERIISEFDAFTTRTAWSRTEAWNLMSGFDGMFDSSDLDNPLKLRYAYALSWWVQKQIETDLASGTITEKGAAIKIANMMEEMDYNPMMIDYYISYMDKAGEDCTQVSEAYSEIKQRLADTQGLIIGESIALDHFWYFNDFGTYSVDDTNGVTPENRQWIRERMRSVTFIQS